MHRQTRKHTCLQLGSVGNKAEKQLMVVKYIAKVLRPVLGASG